MRRVTVPGAVFRPLALLALQACALWLLSSIENYTDFKLLLDPGGGFRDETSAT